MYIFKGNFLIQKTEILEVWDKSGFTRELFIKQNREENVVVTGDLACKAQKIDLVTE